MEALIRFRFWRLALKFYNSNRSRSMNSGDVFSKISGASEILKKYKEMQCEELSYKKNLREKFFSECFAENSMSLISTSPRLFTILPLQKLREKKLILSVSSVINKFLSYLEPFPFNEKSIKVNEERLSLNIIRNVIEKEYLAWKYQIDVQEVDYIYKRFCSSFFLYRSLENLKNNVSLLETIQETHKMNVAEIIYHLNQKPFDLNSVINFQDKIAGIVWFVFPSHCPNILKFSHQYILLLVSILEELKFTERQIQMGLPFLGSFLKTIKKLNYLLGNEELEKYRNEPEFLELLYFNVEELSSLIISNKANFKEMIQLIKLKKRVLSKGAVLFLISQFYEVDRSKLIKARYHPQFKTVLEVQIFETLNFLKQFGFTNKEVEESPSIVFYPSFLIAKTLDKIKNEVETLKKIGFSDDFVSEANFFEGGTKEKRKLLQLCLYYLEKPFHFSGDGIHFPRE